jgi:hypothetical protein
LDYILFALVFAFFFYDILIIITSLLDKLKNLYTDTYTTTDIIYNMISNSDQSTSHNTTVQITHTDAGWSKSIRQIFVYGTGIFRLSLLRAGGTPGQRTFVIATTLASEAASKAVNNAINDPSYVKNHINNWKQIWRDSETIEIHVDKDYDTMTQINENMTQINEYFNNFRGNDLNDFSDKLLNNIIGILKPVLSPLQVDYSNVLLAEQIYGISIMLFILSVLIILLLLAFMLNILILVYSDKLMNLFSNKYIRWYIAFNKKIIGIEICFLGGSILYFMYVLSYGIHFIATHPIIIN